MEIHPFALSKRKWPIRATNDTPEASVDLALVLVLRLKKITDRSPLTEALLTSPDEVVK